MRWYVRRIDEPAGEFANKLEISLRRKWTDVRRGGS